MQMRKLMLKKLGSSKEFEKGSDGIKRAIRKREGKGQSS